MCTYINFLYAPIFIDDYILIVATPCTTRVWSGFTNKVLKFFESAGTKI